MNPRLLSPPAISDTDGTFERVTSTPAANFVAQNDRYGPVKQFGDKSIAHNNHDRLRGVLLMDLRRLFPCAVRFEYRG
jgi:hypothetical protein